MSEARRTESTLAALVPRDAPIAALRVLAPCARFAFRGDEAARAAAAGALGVDLPLRQNTFARAGERLAVKLGPDEWLILAGEGERDEIVRALAARLGSVAHAVVDVSHSREAIELAGSRAAFVLNHGCPLDLDARAFAPGSGTRTVFAKTEIVLLRLDAGTFRIEVARSFAAYLWGLIEDARREL